MPKNWLHLLAGVALIATPAAADVWDIQGANDDTIATRNELVHGTIQTHDLAVRPGPAADQDWYMFSARPQASYEVIIDGGSGDLFSFSTNLSLQRRTTGSVLLQSDVPVLGGAGYARALRWTNTTGSTTLQYIQVSSGACGTACGADDQYTIRARETTVNVPRFNAAGGQTTVLLTQNATERSILMTQFFWSPTGVLLQQNSLTIQPKALNVLNVASFPAVAGQSGSITVAHDGGYGGLAIKAVALEPSTGFSFDTPGVYVPY
jgi:hypothetical protein